MKVQSNNFIPAAQIAINDVDLQTAVSFGTNSAFTKRQAAMFAGGEAHGQALRQQAAAIERHALNHLVDLLEQAEANMQANGIQVLWAIDGDEANQHVLEIARRHGVLSVVKSKSMVTEETGLNHALEAASIDVLETDLGEYIVQIGGETPSHIVAPIVHKTKESIRDLLVAKANMPPTDDTSEMTQFARQLLRERFLAADMEDLRRQLHFGRDRLDLPGVQRRQRPADDQPAAGSRRPGGHREDCGRGRLRHADAGAAAQRHWR